MLESSNIEIEPLLSLLGGGWCQLIFLALDFIGCFLPDSMVVLRRSNKIKWRTALSVFAFSSTCLKLNEHFYELEYQWKCAGRTQLNLNWHFFDECFNGVRLRLSCRRILLFSKYPRKLRSTHWFNLEHVTHLLTMYCIVCEALNGQILANVSRLLNNARRLHPLIKFVQYRIFY